MLMPQFTIFSRSMVARMMLPVVLMLGLVCLLGLVSLSARERLLQARDTVERSQRVQIELIEVRSLSRSLQRDALNLLLERDPRELAIIHAKFAGRSGEMRGTLRTLLHNPAFDGGARRQPFFRNQLIVLDRLAATARQAERGDHGTALATFRRQVRPAEREASAIADALVASQEVIVAALLRDATGLEQREKLVGFSASLILFALAAAAALAIVRRSIARPLFDIERAMDRIASGDTQGRTPHIDRADEIGRMARAIEVFRIAALERASLETAHANLRTAELRRELEQEQQKHAADEADAARSRLLGAAAKTLKGKRPSRSRGCAARRGSCPPRRPSSTAIPPRRAATSSRSARRCRARWTAPPTSPPRPTSS